jgi:hypothetical protein
MAPPQSQWPNYEEKPHVHTESNHSSIAIQVRNKGLTNGSHLSEEYDRSG